MIYRLTLGLLFAMYKIVSCARTDFSNGFDHPFIVSYLGYEDIIEYSGGGKYSSAKLYLEYCEGGELEKGHIKHIVPPSSSTRRNSNGSETDSTNSEADTASPIDDGVEALAKPEV